MLSSMYTNNNRDPKTDPGSTPPSNIFRVDSVPFKTSPGTCHVNNSQRSLED